MGQMMRTMEIERAPHIPQDGGERSSHLYHEVRNANLRNPTSISRFVADNEDVNKMHHQIDVVAEENWAGNTNCSALASISRSLALSLRRSCRAEDGRDLPCFSRRKMILLTLGVGSQ